jgi:hypothetical protein
MWRGCGNHWAKPVTLMTRREEVRTLESGWGTHPDGVEPPADLGPVEPGRAIGLGAICDLRSAHIGNQSSHSFTVGEFLVLEDARRVMLHQERGFTIGPWRSISEFSVDALKARDTVESLTQHVMTVVLPDEDESGESHPWDWLATLAGRRGLSVTADELRGLPYAVVFTDEVHRWLDSAR